MTFKLKLKPADVVEGVLLALPEELAVVLGVGAGGFIMLL